MVRAAVLGSPVSHSLSPALHTAGYAACGLGDWRYVAREVGADALEGVLAGLDEQWRGLSLTMPLKEVGLRLARRSGGEVSEVAARAGAANTLVRRDDLGWDADNTDVHGLVEALRPHLPEQPWRGVVLGSGATARSAVLALEQLGAPAVECRARTASTRDALLAWAAGLEIDVAGHPLTPWDGATPVVAISTVPPAGAASAVKALPEHASGVLLDVVYAGWPTPLARAAEGRGLTVVSGLDMLVHQAARQFELFTGHPAPLAEMTAAARAGAAAP